MFLKKKPLVSKHREIFCASIKWKSNCKTSMDLTLQLSWPDIVSVLCVSLQQGLYAVVNTLFREKGGGKDSF